MDREKNNPKIGFTENSNHGLGSVKGSLDSHNEAGMTAEVIVVPNVGTTTYHKKEVPSDIA